MLETPDVTAVELNGLSRRNPAPNVGQEAVTVKIGDAVDLIRKMKGRAATFRITVTSIKNYEQATVKVESDGRYRYIDWMCACEYFLHKTATECVRVYGGTYDDALKSLCEGSKTYFDKVIKLRR